MRDVGKGEMMGRVDTIFEPYIGKYSKKYRFINICPMYMVNFIHNFTL